MKNPKIIFDVNSFNLDKVLDIVKKLKKDSKGLTSSKLKKVNKKIKGGHVKCQRQVVSKMFWLQW